MFFLSTLLECHQRLVWEGLFFLSIHLFTANLYKLVQKCWLIVWCFMPLSTICQLYHGISWVSYQYYWSIYPDNSQSVVMLTMQPWAPMRAAITTILKVFVQNCTKNSKRLRSNCIYTLLDTSHCLVRPSSVLYHQLYWTFTE